MPLSLTRLWLFAGCFLCACIFCEAQSIVNSKYSYVTRNDGTQVLYFNFDISSIHNNIPCYVRVKYTAGAREFYLKEVKGDVGNLVYPGTGKLIIWDFREELIHNTSAETVTINVEVFPNISAETKVKRGKSIIVNLDEIYEKGKNYTVKLYRKEKEVLTLKDSLALEHHFAAEIPRNAKVGKDYQIGIFGGEKPLFTNAFKVKPRVATFWKVFPFIAVPIVIVIQQHKDDFKDLPGAPQNPTN